jgi:hypothetical protein
MEQGMSKFVKDFISAGGTLDCQAQQIIHSPSADRFDGVRRLIQKSLDTLQELYEKTIEFGIPTPMPPANIPFFTQIDVGNWQEWPWVFRRTLKNYVEECGRLAESVIALAPRDSVFGLDARQSEERAERTRQAYEALQNHRAILADIEKKLYGFDSDLDNFAPYISTLSRASPPIPDSVKEQDKKVCASIPGAAAPKTGEKDSLDAAAAGTEPTDYLLSWREILTVLKRDCTEENQRLVRTAHDKYPGPIFFFGQGAQPKVVRQKLIEWWNHLEIQFADQQNQKQGAEIDVEDQHNYGRKGTVAPNIGGGVKRRRADRGQPR